MANQKNRKVSVIGAVLLAAVLGAVIGAVIFHSPGTPLPSPSDVEFKGEYDDSWGKLDPPVLRCGAEHILVSWDGASGPAMPKAERSKEEARKLIEQVWHKYKNEPIKTNWMALQEKYNEDAQPPAVYAVPSAKPPKEVATCAKATKVGFARIVEAGDAFYLVRRDS